MLRLLYIKVLNLDCRRWQSGEGCQEKNIKVTSCNVAIQKKLSLEGEFVRRVLDR